MRLSTVVLVAIATMAGLASTLWGQQANPCECYRGAVVDGSLPQRGQPIPLFDGKTLDGWEKRNGEAPKNWVVENGTLYRQSFGGDLYHEHWWQDFELTFEWKIKAGGNSGVKYRVQQYGTQPLGCEYQLQDDKQAPLTKQSTGGLYAIYAPSANKPDLKVGEWNQSKIVICGQRAEHWLNGEKIVDANIGSLDWLQRVEKSKFRDKEFFGQNREGRIFLQDHGHPVWFRKIVIVPLNCGAPF